MAINTAITRNTPGSETRSISADKIMGIVMDAAPVPAAQSPSASAVWSANHALMTMDTGTIPASAYTTPPSSAPHTKPTYPVEKL